MPIRDEIRFLLNDREVRLREVRASDTLLDHLRLVERLRGTKEGCAEGDCGACTVLIGRRSDGDLVYEPVNACIRLLASVDLCHVVTVEHLAQGGVLHPVQRAMVELHGSQCGFCTPGIVMSLAALRMRNGDPSEAEIETALQGNLCRCTGYQPIVAAAKAACADGAGEPLVMGRAEVLARLSALGDWRRVELRTGGERVVLPVTVDDLAEVLGETPEATIVAGSTDVGLWVTKQMRDISPAVFIGHLEGLRGIEVAEAGMTFGAGVSYDEAEAVLGEAFPHLADYLRRIGGWQVRAMGTIGGNIANGSPIGDMPPVLIALGATLTLRRGAVRRVMALDAFFIDYGKQDRAPGEFVEYFFVPRPAAGTLNAAYKVSKRRDEDISAVACGFHVGLENGVVTEARLAYGGMAATPKRAAKAEAALLGRPWTEATVVEAGAALGGRLQAAHRLAGLGGVPGDGGAEPAAALLAGERQYAGAAAAGARGLMADGMAGSIRGGVNSPQRHDSAHKHVTGAADYTDDIPEPVGTLHAWLGLAGRAHAEITGMDFDAVRAAPGVVGVLTAADIPGVNDVSPTGKHDDPVFADGRVEFHGQPVFAVVAETRDLGRRAAALAKVDYRVLPHVTDVAEAVEAGYPFVTEPLKLERGEVGPALEAAQHRLSGRMRVGGQDHFYLESHIAFALPGEDDEVTVYSSTQHPSEVQHMVAHVLGVPSNAVTVIVRRMGGGFGGKETQPNLFAAVAAVAAKKFGRAVKLRPDRDDDMIATGKRHDFLIDYDVGFDGEGRIEAVDAVLAARCGFSADLSGPVTDRALFHADNAYFYPHVRLVSKPMKTNTVSNTAYRGFGGPQGLIMAERIMEEIGYALGRDPLAVRKANFYGGAGRDITPYHQQVQDNVIARIVEELEASSDYDARRRAVLAFNAQGGVIRKGIALTPVKFGISFTATWYNQAGALVHVYNDGSIHLNHGGTEMGQGLNVKVAQVVADAFQVDLDRVRITATTTAKVPNTSATAASSGTDLNAMAAQNAAEQIRDRLVDFAAEKYSVGRDQVVFEPNVVRIGNRRVAFDDFIREAYMGAGASVGGGLLQDAGHPLGPGGGQGAALLLLRLWRGGQRGEHRHADRRVPRRPHRHPARRRPVAEPGGGSSARSRAPSCREWGG